MTKLLPFLTVALLLTLAACDGSQFAGPTAPPPVAQSVSYLGTQVGNERWLWTFTGSNFSATAEVAGLHYSGTATPLPSGFQKLTITASDDPALTNLPTTAYALAMPGEALLVKPSIESLPTRAVVAGGLGHCPSADATFSWVAVPKDAWGVSDFSIGQTLFAVSSTSVDLTLHFQHLDGTSQSNAFPTGYTCSSGRLTAASDPAQFVVSPSGLFVANCGPVISGLMGTVDPDSSFTVTDLTGPGHNFRGMLFQNQSAGDQTTLVWAAGDHNGGINLNVYTNVDTNVESTSSATASHIALGVPISQARYPGSLTDANGAHTFQYVVTRLLNGKFVVFGFGTTVASGQVVPYNVVLLEQ